MSMEPEQPRGPPPSGPSPSILIVLIPTAHLYPQVPIARRPELLVEPSLPLSEGWGLKTAQFRNRGVPHHAIELTIDPASCVSLAVTCRFSPVSYRLPSACG